MAAFVNLVSLTLSTVDTHCDLAPLRALVKLKAFKPEMAGHLRSRKVDLASVALSQLEQLELGVLPRRTQLGPLCGLERLVRVTLKTDGTDVTALEKALSTPRTSGRILVLTTYSNIWTTCDWRHLRRTQRPKTTSTRALWS